MILDRFRLDGQKAIVTGASRGLGAAMAAALAEAGADVVLVARGDLDSAAAAVEHAGRAATRVQADLADRTAPAKIMEAAGDATILVNNAGIIRRAPALEFSDGDWDEVIEVNLRSVFVLSRDFARAVTARGASGRIINIASMLSFQGGLRVPAYTAAKSGLLGLTRALANELAPLGPPRIINIASMLSFQGGLRVPAYTAAKSGLLGLTRALANELAPLGINVNAIAPGYMTTDNTQALRDDATRSREIVSRIPAARWGAPEDVQGAVVYLASPAAAYVHGAVLAVDGGWLAR